MRKAMTAGVLTDEEANAAVEYLWALDLQEIPATLERHRRALAWAVRELGPVTLVQPSLSSWPVTVGGRSPR